VVRQYLSEILEVFRVAQYSRLLIKNETPTALDGELLNYLADEIVKQGSQGLKIAIVDELPDNENRDHRSADSARGTGLDVASFNSFAPAVHWLLYG
jgi:hypothetical protein